MKNFGLKKHMLSFTEWEKEFQNFQKASNTKIIGKNVILLPEIPSTNIYLKEHNELKHGTVVTAYEQLKGKGQKDRKWISKPGGLYLSIKLDILSTKNFSPFWITATVAIGFCKALNQIQLQPTIKWPNDLLLNGKKVAGILTETIMTNNSITAIIGIGLNVNNDLNEIITLFPDLQSKVTTLQHELQQSDLLHFSNILVSALEYIESTILTINFPDIDAIKNEWLEYADIEAKKVTIEKIDSHEIITGIVTKITDAGSLLIKTDLGKVEEFTSGEIKFIK